jgi:hypothetical protein
MRKLLFALTSFVAVTLAAPSRATVMDFTGEMFIRIGATIPPATLTGSGTASLQTSAGGRVTQLTIPKGFFSNRTFLPVPNAFPIIQVVLTGTAGGLTNQTIMVTDAGVCNPDPAHISSFPPTGMGNVPKRGINCPGGGLAGFGGLGGTAFVGLFFAPVNSHTPFSSFAPIGTLVHTPGSSSTASFFTHTNGSQATFKPNFPVPIQNLAVPLSKVGEGSITTVTGGGIRVTVSGAGWTTGTAAIYNPTIHPQTHVPLTYHFPVGPRASRTVLPSQSLSKPTSGTTETLMGGQGTTGMGKLQIQLVSPVQVLNNATDAFSNTIVQITLTQAPEPGELFLLGLGMVAFSLYGGWRMRK